MADILDVANDVGVFGLAAGLGVFEWSWDRIVAGESTRGSVYSLSICPVCIAYGLKRTLGA